MPDVIFFLGLLVDLISFYLIAIGQIQMGQSWRIGFDTKEKTELVRLGLYGYSRNPIYVGMMLSFLGNFLLLPNSISLLTCVMSFVLLQILTRLEEAHLSMLHGNPYLEYCRQVRRWF
jgi:protein-S-isoprenylcysteine O-methyltransferase Ste14